MSNEKISNYRPQRRNANKHNQRGMGLLQKSIEGDGFIGAMTSAADGEIIAGSARLEKSAEVFGVDAEPIVIETDGTKPIIVKRTDIPSADDERAKRLAIADNRVQEIDLEWDTEVLQGLAEFDGIDLGDWWRDGELSVLFGEQPSDDEWADAFGGLPSKDRAPFQQMTFTLHDTQVEQVKEALKIAKSMGEFDTPNENSNGNALARIVETYITDYGQG